MKNILVTFFSHTGNTKSIAEKISYDTGGDLFEIKTVEPYPADYNTVVALAKKELNAAYRPKLASKVVNMEIYDVVFIGYPNWWSTMPTGVFTFLEEYDFSGKTIIPFCTHEGSGLGRSERDLAKLCPNSKLLEGLAVRGSSVGRSHGSVTSWLDKLGFAKQGNTQ